MNLELIRFSKKNHSCHPESQFWYFTAIADCWLPVETISIAKCIYSSGPTRRLENRYGCGQLGDSCVAPLKGVAWAARRHVQLCRGRAGIWLASTSAARNTYLKQKEERRFISLGRSVVRPPIATLAARLALNRALHSIRASRLI